MSTIIDRLCGLLAEEKELMLSYEQATLALLECKPEGAEHYITERERLASEVDALREAAGRLCVNEPGGALLLETTKGRTELSRVPAEYHPVFYAAQAVQLVVGRVTHSNVQVLERLEKLRGEALDVIKHRQNLPKIRRYLTGLTEGETLTLHDGKA